MKYTALLQKLGLATNEAKIYETLLQYGESSVGTIATKANINRRNVYDSLNRLLEKGYIFEIRGSNENLYQSVDPQKLLEEINELKTEVADALPDLLSLQDNTPTSEKVFIYRGIEGWKNYLRNILRVNQDVYTIGAKGSWSDPQMRPFLKRMIRDYHQAGIKFKVLFDHETKTTKQEILELLDGEHRFLPPEYSTSTAVEVFGDYTVMFSKIEPGVISKDSSLTVIQNPEIANSYRTWFKALWEISSE